MATVNQTQQGYSQNQRSDPYASNNILSDSQNQRLAESAYAKEQAKYNNRIESEATYQSNGPTTTTGYTQSNGYSINNSTTNGAENWTMREPERIELQRQGAHVGKIIEFKKKRTKSLLTLADKIILEETEYIASEKVYLEQTKFNLENIKSKVRQSVNQDSQEAYEIQKKIDALDNEKVKRTNEAQATNNERAKQESEMQAAVNLVNTLNTARKQTAAKIDPHDLSHSKLAEKSPLHDLFSWCLVVIYGEQESNYYWDNFRKEAFEKDKGQDFKNRSKGLKYKMNSEQIQITQRVIKNIDQINAEINSNAASGHHSNQSLKDLIEYVKLMDKINTQLDTIKALDIRQEKAIQDAEIKNSNLEEITVQTEGYQSRLQMINQFNTSFNAIHQSLEKLQGMCQTRANSQASLAERMKQDLSAMKISQLEVEEVSNSPVKVEEHKHIHGKVESQMKTQETEFTDSGKRAQSCQECNIF